MAALLVASTGAMSAAVMPACAHAQGQVGRFEVYRSVAPNGMAVYTVKPPADRPAQRVFAFEGRAAPASSFARAGAGAAPLAPARELLPLVTSLAQRHRIDAALVMAVMEVESAFDARAQSPAGAIGLMQLMPQTARRYGADPWNARANVEAGVRYLGDLFALFAGDPQLALAAYNAGERRVIRAGWRVPPIAETELYVPKVMERQRVWRQRLAAAGLNSQADIAMEPRGQPRESSRGEVRP